MQVRAARRPRYWLHILLLALTFCTTTFIGAWLAHDFAANRAFSYGDDFSTAGRILRTPALWPTGLPFSLTLLAILLAHEFGHYFACVYYRVDATLPFFLPAPTPIGTLGAFIKIRSPITGKRDLFDIGIAGPLAGFIVLVPALAIGVSLSKVVPGFAESGGLLFGRSLFQKLLEAALFPGVPGADIYLHPVARAAWVGGLATALNLLPIGQLDGGHIVYALFGRYHWLLSRVFIAVLVPLGVIFSFSWLVWAVLLFFFALRHPALYDDRPVGAGRAILAVLALAIFIGCFTLAPVEIIE
ncbi:MAG: site-2 protease family protein [Bryobacteraceae bacterium]